GDMDDLQKLIEEAHDKDIQVILELDLHYVAETNPLVEEESSWFKEVDAESVSATEWLDDAAAFDDSKKEVHDYLGKVADVWMDETDIDGINIHAPERRDKDFLSIITAEWKKSNPECYVVATALDQKEEIDDLATIDTTDAGSNVGMFEGFNDTLT